MRFFCSLNWAPVWDIEAGHFSRGSFVCGNGEADDGDDFNSYNNLEPEKKCQKKKILN